MKDEIRLAALRLRGHVPGHRDYSSGASPGEWASWDAEWEAWEMSVAAELQAAEDRGRREAMAYWGLDPDDVALLMASMERAKNG